MIYERLFVIDVGYAVFGIITARYTPIVIEAAPIAKWTIGKNIIKVLHYYAVYKKARIQIMYLERFIYE